MSKTVLVTGATGFIAQQIILDLLDRGYKVRGTIRSMAKAQHLREVLGKHSSKAAELELVAADLEKDDGWVEAVAGVDCVMHVASPFFLEVPKDPQELIRPAKEGTLRVLRAAKTAGTKRVVLTSSCASIIYGYDQLPAVLNEENWSDPSNVKDCPAYPASKTLAEKAAWDYVTNEAPELELAVINPVGVFGPILSSDVRASISLVEQLMNGKLPMAVDSGIQFIDVRDVSLAHIAAMEKPEAAGQRFALAGDYLSLLETAKILGEQFPHYKDRMPTRVLPSFIIHLLAFFDAQMKSATFELGKRRFVSSEKAKEKLLDGREFISARDSLRASGESLIEYGVVE